MPLYTRPSIIVLGSSATAVSGAADTNENILATITVPAGLMGLNGVLRWEALWSRTNNANVITLRARFGGGSGTVFSSLASASIATYRDFKRLQNRASASSQVGGPSNTSGQELSGTGGVAVTSSVDTSAATSLVFSAAKATAGDTVTLESYLVELIIP